MCICEYICTHAFTRYVHCYRSDNSPLRSWGSKNGQSSTSQRYMSVYVTTAVCIFVCMASCVSHCMYVLLYVKLDLTRCVYLLLDVWLYLLSLCVYQKSSNSRSSKKFNSIKCFILTRYLHIWIFFVSMNACGFKCIASIIHSPGVLLSLVRMYVVWYTYRRSLPLPILHFSTLSMSLILGALQHCISDGSPAEIQNQVSTENMIAAYFLISKVRTDCKILTPLSLYKV